MKLSIITINFNNLAGLKKTADSVISQTWKEFEWIIIDGGSTDGSKEFIVSLNDDLNRNRWNPIAYWCSEPDKGIYNAMNKGIAKASGEYLNFMNSGDCFYEDNSLELLSQFFMDSAYDIIIGKEKKDTGELHSKKLTSIGLAKTLLLYNLVCHQATFIKTYLNRKYPYDETLKIVSDWKFFLMVLNKENLNVKFLDSVIVENEPNGISGNTLGYQMERKKVSEELYGKGCVEIISEYKEIIRNEFLRPTTLLLKNDLFLYRFLRRCMSIVMKFYNIRHKNKQ